MPNALQKPKILKIAVEFIPGVKHLYVQIDSRGNIQLRPERARNWLPPLALRQLYLRSCELAAIPPR